MFALLRTIWRENLTNVPLPRELVIRSNRLGMLLKIVQVVVAVGLICYTILGEVWLSTTPVKPFALSVWTSAPVDQAREANPSVRHCVAPEDYRFSRDGGRDYRPSSCRPLAPADASVSLGTRDLFVPLHAIDNNTWSARGAGPCEELRATCAAVGGTATGPGPAPGSSDCGCGLSDEFFVRNAEEIMIHFMHGWSVEEPSLFSGEPPLRRQVASSDDVERLGHDGRQAIREPMVTVLQHRDGSPCYVGGRSTWEARNIADAGVHGSLREWLVCGGLSMDSAPHSGAASPRLTGFSLVFDLHYTHESRFGGSACIVTVDVHPSWTMRTSHRAAELPRASGGIRRGSFAREAYGAIVEFEVSGSVRFLDIMQLVAAIIRIFILTKFSQTMVQFVVLYGMGMTSEVYRHAKATRFDMSEQLKVTMAKQCIPSGTFRFLLGLDGGDVGPVSTRRLRGILREMFAVELAEGILEGRHISRMASLLLSDLSGDQPLQLSMHDHLSLCMRTEVITMKELLDIVHVNRHMGFLERLVDPTSALSAGAEDLDPSQSSTQDCCKAVTSEEQGEEEPGEEMPVEEEPQEEAARASPGAEFAAPPIWGVLCGVRGLEEKLAADRAAHLERAKLMKDALAAAEARARHFEARSAESEARAERAERQVDRAEQMLESLEARVGTVTSTLSLGSWRVEALHGSVADMRSRLGSPGKTRAAAG